jgi:hypothetical protein
VSSEFDPGLRRHIQSLFETAEAAPPSYLAAVVAARLRAAGPRRNRARVALTLATAALVATVGVVGVAQALRSSARPPVTVPAGHRPTPSELSPQVPEMCGGSGGGTATTGDAVSVAVSSHPDYDQVVFQFSGVMPHFRVVSSGSAQFTSVASGQTVVLEGTSGIEVTLSGIDSPGYSGPSELRPGFQALREARLIGNSEGVMNWAFGIGGPGCYRLAVLTNPSRLVVFIPTPASG